MEPYSPTRGPGFNTLTLDQIEELIRRAGYIPDYRRENAILARAFWRENWHRGFWPTVRARL